MLVRKERSCTTLDYSYLAPYGDIAPHEGSYISDRNEVEENLYLFLHFGLEAICKYFLCCL